MPQFEIKDEQSEGIGTATFSKKEDYMAIKLKGDTKTVILHKLHAEKLIKKGVAEEDKKAKFEKRPAEDSQMAYDPKENQ